MKSLPRSATLTLAAAIIVMVAGVLISVRFRARPAPAESSRPPAFFSELPEFSVPGWSVKELPIGDTELSRTIVEQTLRYDEALFLQFKSAQREFAVYAAFWRPGKVELRAVNAHTPDTCWVNSGWNTVDKVHRYTGTGEGPMLHPGEFRCYTNQGTIQYVAFWHLVGGQPVPMWRNGFPLFSYMWEIFSGDRSQLSSEQLFIRISSPHDFAALWDEPAFQQVLRQLAPLAPRT